VYFGLRLRFKGTLLLLGYQIVPLGLLLLFSVINQFEAIGEAIDAAMGKGGE
jgi:hypothetical protein